MSQRCTDSFNQTAANWVWKGIFPSLASTPADQLDLSFNFFFRFWHAVMFFVISGSNWTILSWIKLEKLNISWSPVIRGWWWSLKSRPVENHCYIVDAIINTTLNVIQLATETQCNNHRYGFIAALLGEKGLEYYHRMQPKQTRLLVWTCKLFRRQMNATRTEKIVDTCLLEHTSALMKWISAKRRSKCTHGCLPRHCEPLSCSEDLHSGENRQEKRKENFTCERQSFQPCVRMYTY